MKRHESTFFKFSKIVQIKNTQKEKEEIYIEEILKAFFRESNLTKSRALVKMFASCFSVV